MSKIAPSILSANFSNIGEDIEIIEKKTNVKYIHIDVMDGNFVPNITIGQPFIKSIRKISNLIFDVHLMIEKPERYIEDFKKAGADILTVHLESTVHLNRVLSEIKKLGMKVGVSINPSTPVEMLYECLDMVDLVLIMSVNPGFGGQSFIENSINKIKKLDKIKKEKGYEFIIEVDGGINDNTIKKAKDAGANLFVAGSYIFKDGKIEENINKLNEIVK